MSKGLASLSLQKKVSVTLLAVMATLVLLTYVILHSVVGPAFDRLEIDDARRNLIRAERAIESDLEVLDAINRDWASWDDSYAYVLGNHTEFRKSNLDRPTLTNLNLNLLLVVDASGQELWGQVLHEGNVLRSSALGMFGEGDVRAENLLLHTAVDDYTRGLLRTDLGPMLFTSRPILTSLDEGPIAGAMIMAQFLNDARMESLRKRTEVEMSWQEVTDDLPVDRQLVHALNGGEEQTVLHRSSAESIVSSGMLHDLNGEPLLILRVITPRDVSALGVQTVNGALLFLSLAGVVLAVVTWSLLRSIIVLPLEGLARHIDGIRKSGDLEQKLNASRADEIGSLAAEFDKMTTELHGARRLLLEQSFKAGKADTAAEVLHNIRNAMTPLINGLDRLGKHFKVTEKLRVDQVTQELRNPDGDGERRVKLIQYVDSAFVHVKATCNDAQDELAIVSKQARQVEAILSDQERHANVRPVIEELDLATLVDEAVLIVPKKDDLEIEINLPEPLQGFRVRAHRVGLIQVLGNVILNAYESIRRCPPGTGRICLRARKEVVDDKPMVCVTISDTGCGFDLQTSKKIFRRGYSSKVGHMGGLGLHWCANALAGMGGRIVAESGGPGSGAEFHVLLPAAQGGCQ